MVGSAQTRGITLPELVAVIVILALLAVVALPRLTQLEQFCAGELADTVLATLRFARSGAVAHGRPVCVQIYANRIGVTMANARDGNPCVGSARNPFLPPGLGGDVVVGDTIAAPPRCRAVTTVTASDATFLFCPRGDVRTGSDAAQCRAQLLGTGSGSGGLIELAITTNGTSRKIVVSPAGAVWHGE